MFAPPPLDLRSLQYNAFDSLPPLSLQFSQQLPDSWSVAVPGLTTCRNGDIQTVRPSVVSLEPKCHPMPADDGSRWLKDVTATVTPAATASNLVALPRIDDPASADPMSHHVSHAQLLCQTAAVPRKQTAHKEVSQLETRFHMDQEPQLLELGVSSHTGSQPDSAYSSNVFLNHTPPADCIQTHQFTNTLQSHPLTQTLQSHPQPIRPRLVRTNTAISQPAAIKNGLATPSENPEHVFTAPTAPRMDRSQVVHNLVDTAATIIENIWRTHTTSPTTLLPLRPFIEALLRRSRTSFSTLQLALFYLLRLCTTKQSTPATTTLCGRRMFLASLVVASKYLQDKNFSNRAWARICSLDVAEVNAVEREFLAAVEYRVHVEYATFVAWSALLLQKCTGGGPLPAPIPVVVPVQTSEEVRFEGGVLPSPPMDGERKRAREVDGEDADVKRRKMGEVKLEKRELA